jgi:hypothetical protein
MKLDELARSLAQSVRPGGAAKKFDVGLAVIVLALVRLAHKAQATRTTIAVRPRSAE